MARETLDEFQRIRRFYAPLAGPGGLGLLDDAALVDCRGGRRLVVTADAIVEGVHYLPDDPPDLVARKLLRVNLSDLAAMAARPLHYLLTTALPPKLGAEWLAAFVRGLKEDQHRFGVDLLGGDSVATPGPASLSLTAIGEVAAGMEVRAAVRTGDLVWVSGTIGDSFLARRAGRPLILNCRPSIGCLDCPLPGSRSASRA
jgi:thiamine-monophosphate kinase